MLCFVGFGKTSLTIQHSRCTRRLAELQYPSYETKETYSQIKFETTKKRIQRTLKILSRWSPSAFHFNEPIEMNHCISSFSTFSKMSNETLSKSKKKRLKRLAAQKRREEEAQTLLTTPYIPEDSFNPLDKLREKLTAQDGYELSLVDCAMDEMWNLGLEYGEYPEVKIFLENNVHELLVKLELKQQAQQKQAKEEPKRVTFVQEPVVEPIVEKKEEKQQQHIVKNQIQKEEDIPVIVDEEVPEEATPAILVDEDEEIKGSSFANVTPEPEVVQEVTPITVPVSAPAPVAAKKAEEVVEQPTSLDLMTKLDIVANTDDLNDAIIALTEWINKAATPEEVSIFILLHFLLFLKLFTDLSLFLFLDSKIL